MIRFYYVSGSPFSWRVQLTLEEKGLEYEPVLLQASKGEMRTDEHLARSPHGKVPALTDGDLSLYESTAIVEYLEERYPDNPVMPSDPAARGLTRVEELECLLYFFEPMGKLGRQLFFTPEDERDEKVVAEARSEVSAELARLESRASRRGGEYLMGSTLTRADLTWLPFAEMTVRTSSFPDPAQLPWLGAWLKRMRSRPAYEASYPPHWRA